VRGASVVWAKAQGVREFLTSFHDLKVVAINCVAINCVAINCVAVVIQQTVLAD
jgi:hypothetical protein